MDESVVDSTNATDCEDKVEIVFENELHEQNKIQQTFRIMPNWNDPNNYIWPSIATNNEKVMISLDHEFVNGHVSQSLPSFIQISNLNQHDLLSTHKNVYQNNPAGLQNSSSHYSQGFSCQSPIGVEMVIADQANNYSDPYYQTTCLKHDAMQISGAHMGNQIVSASVPSSISYRGQYGFEISFDKHSKENKSITWTYSEELEKLYVRMGSTCPIKFRCVISHPPSDSIIRATPVYIRPEHVQEVVTRCPNHSSGESGDSHPAPSNLMRCEHKMARYVTDRVTNRQSVIVPLEHPQVGAQWVTNLYQFMCFSSCVGGLNRRPVRVIFTLESGANIIGRQSFEVRICACPVRDRRVEEGGNAAGHRSKTPVLAPRIEANKRTSSQVNSEESLCEDALNSRKKKKVPTATLR